MLYISSFLLDENCDLYLKGKIRNWRATPFLFVPCFPEEEPKAVAVLSLEESLS